MENASKALIIAAAILISILIITIGVYVLGIAQDQIKSSGMSKVEVTTFNSNFEKYVGVQKGSAVRTMVQEVMANNNSAEASDETRVSVNGGNNAGANPVVSLSNAEGASPVYNDFKNTKTYDVDVEYKNGRVYNITVKAHSNSTTNP